MARILRGRGELLHEIPSPGALSREGRREGARRHQAGGRGPAARLAEGPIAARAGKDRRVLQKALRRVKPRSAAKSRCDQGLAYRIGSRRGEGSRAGLARSPHEESPRTNYPSQRLAPPSPFAEMVWLTGLAPGGLGSRPSVERSAGQSPREKSSRSNRGTQA